MTAGMGPGWVCSHRTIWEHPIFKGDALRVGVWHWMLHMAARERRTFNTGAGDIELDVGELCVSQRQICEATGIGRQALRTLLEALEATHDITRRQAHGATQGRTIIRLCNYDKNQHGTKRPNPEENQAATQEKPINKQANKSNNPPSEEIAAAPPSGEMIEVSVLSKAVWDVGKTFLTSRGIANPGAMIGRWLKGHKPGAILEAIEQAQRAGTRDPVPYITQILNGGNHHGTASSSKPTHGHAGIDEAAFAARYRRASGKDCF